MYTKTDASLQNLWKNQTLEGLKQFIAIKSLSPDFDKDWEEHGELLRSLTEAKAFALAQLKDIHIEVLEAKGKTPLLFFEIPATENSKAHGDVLFYGHMDKQPAADGWSKNRSAFTPAIENGLLYGRGAADDGYSFYAAISIAKALEESGEGHPRLFGIFETAEESGSEDFPFWISQLSERFTRVSLVLVLDAGCIDYKHLCITTNFRGVLGTTLKVSVLEHGVHSGTASGIVPDSFMIARHLLERLEDSSTGKILGKAFYAAEIPPSRLTQIQEKARVIREVENDFPWIDKPVMRSADTEEILLAQTWLPQLAIIGADGLPAIGAGGNVLRSDTSLRLSIRLPPTVDPVVAQKALEKTLLANPPFGAKVEMLGTYSFKGWDAPAESDWFTQIVKEASSEVFDTPAIYSGEGGSLSIFDTLEAACPVAQFLLTGVLGPHSNAHGPDEALHLEYVENLCRALARIVSRLP